MLAMVMLAASPAVAQTANVQEAGAFFGDQDATQTQIGSEGSVQLGTQAQAALQSQAAFGSGFHTVNFQTAVADFGDQTLVQNQIDSNGSVQTGFQGQGAFQSQAIFTH
jgi:hypothetical protein